MNKYISILFTSTFVLTVVLFTTNTYYGSLAFYALGIMPVKLGFIYKGKTNPTGCF